MAHLLVRGKKLLEQTKERILKEPAQFIMSDFFASVNASYSDLRREIPNCGTAACIAGWVISLDAKLDPRAAAQHSSFEAGFRSRELQAAALLFGKGKGLWRAKKLFYASAWPQGLSDAWYHSSTLEGRAKVAAKRIDMFIAEHPVRERGKK